jgi:anaerobic C4-dicarboxylate transporter
MKKVVVGEFEVEVANVVMGAIVATGLGCIVLGVKNLFDVRKINKQAEEPFDEDLEFEEYKANKRQKFNKKKNRKIRRGIIGIALGSFVAAVGVAAFTPFRSIIVNDDFSLKKDRIYLINDKVQSVRGIADEKLQDAKVAADVKFQDAKATAGEKLKDAKALLDNIHKVKKIIDKIESKIS